MIYLKLFLYWLLVVLLSPFFFVSFIARFMWDSLRGGWYAAPKFRIFLSRED